MSEAADKRAAPRVPPHSLAKRPWHLLSYGLGAGLLPGAPGTFGTVVAVPLFLLLEPLATPLYLAVVAVLAVLGVWLCGATARALAVHDHPSIVWDEVVGYLVTMAAAPADWRWVLAGFVLFRLFDITKPWPIRAVDRRVHGGFGIMLDDVLAGIYGWLALQALAWAT
ncbi:MAG TPA: phosphatidylglycerophosphatase A [Gammaproteobacteria bacterium]|nr:phosphatidylglycerophosphatase A [Gammaproteobacteria bacterium]